MNGGQHSEAPTPSQIASHRGHSDGHVGHDHITPSQIARENQLTGWGHGPSHGQEMIEAQIKPPDMGWAQWELLNRQRKGGNEGSEQGSLERGRVLPDEELDHNKGRSR